MTARTRTARSGGRRKRSGTVRTASAPTPAPTRAIRRTAPLLDTPAVLAGPIRVEDGRAALPPEGGDPSQDLAEPGVGWVCAIDAAFVDRAGRDAAAAEVGTGAAARPG